MITVTGLSDLPTRFASTRRPSTPFSHRLLHFVNFLQESFDRNASTKPQIELKNQQFDRKEFFSYFKKINVHKIVEEFVEEFVKVKSEK